MNPDATQPTDDQLKEIYQQQHQHTIWMIEHRRANGMEDKIPAIERGQIDLEQKMRSIDPKLANELEKKAGRNARA